MLGIGDQTELAAALERITGAVGRSRPGVSANRVLVQKMINGLGEALIGFRRDPEVGPIVMLAAGGIATELYKDTSIRMAPVDIIAAHEMIEDVKGMQLFAGFRGRPRADLNALASAIVALSRLAETGDIVEAEINPLILTANGVFAVDAVVHKARETGSI